MNKRYTTAQKRQIVTNLFLRRNTCFVRKYEKQKDKKAISDWERTQKDLKAWLLDRIDEGISQEVFFRLVGDYGWPMVIETIEEQDLLYGYTIELEDMYPDVIVEEQVEIESAQELRELKKEKV